MLRAFWHHSFPIRGTVSSINQPSLRLEISYLGYATVTGQLNNKDFDLPLSVSAKKLFKLPFDKPLVTTYYVINRYTDEPNRLRIFFCDQDGRATLALFSRPELEKFIDEEF